MEAAMDGNGSRTKKSFAHLALLREIESPRLHTVTGLQPKSGLRLLGQRAPVSRLPFAGYQVRSFRIS